MRYIIYGAGGIGSIMGGHLFRTQHDVVLIGRSGKYTLSQLSEMLGIEVINPPQS